MKILLLAIALSVFIPVAQAQAVGTSVQPVEGPSYMVPDHPVHASYGDLRVEQSLLNSNSVSAHGERPVSDFPKDRVYEKPLGDVAREYRADHKDAEKAQIQWDQP